MSLNAQYRNVYNQMALIDTTVDDIIIEGGDPEFGGSSRKIGLTIGTGALGIRSNDEMSMLSYPNPEFADNIAFNIRFGPDPAVRNLRFDVALASSGAPGSMYVQSNMIYDETIVSDLFRLDGNALYIPSFPDGTVTLNDTHTIVYLNLTDKDNGIPPIGEVWAFGAETVSHQMYTNYGQYLSKFYNTAIVTNFPDSTTGQVVSSPTMLIRDDSLSLFYLGITSTGASSIQAGNYEAVMESRGSKVVIIEDIPSVRFAFRGTYSDAWRGYYLSSSDSFSEKNDLITFIPETGETFDLKLVISSITMELSFAGQ